MTLSGWLICVASVLGQQESTKDLATVDSAWTDRFERTDGWIGGDAAYTVPLEKDRVLWLFADTYFGRVQGGHRTNAVMVNNSLAIQTKKDGQVQLDFPTFLSTEGKPKSWLEPENGKGWFWPAAGLKADDRVVVCLWRVQKHDHQEGAFGFKYVGTDLAIISQFGGEPATWTIHQQSLPWEGVKDGKTTMFGSAMIAVGEEAYIYGVRQTPGFLPLKELLLAKVPLKNLTDASDWRFWQPNAWVNDPSEATPLAKDVADEVSVNYDAPRQRWVMIHTEKHLGPHIMARTAPEPWGPWSEAQPVYRCPEKDWDKRIFCYAAKGHALPQTDEILVTYVSNSQDFRHVLDDPRLYRPRGLFLRLELLK